MRFCTRFTKTLTAVTLTRQRFTPVRGRARKGSAAQAATGVGTGASAEDREETSVAVVVAAATAAAVASAVDETTGGTGVEAASAALPPDSVARAEVLAALARWVGVVGTMPMGRGEEGPVEQASKEAADTEACRAAALASAVAGLGAGSGELEGWAAAFRGVFREGI